MSGVAKTSIALASVFACFFPAALPRRTVTITVLVMDGRTGMPLKGLPTDVSRASSVRRYPPLRQKNGRLAPSGYSISSGDGNASSLKGAPGALPSPPGLSGVLTGPDGVAAFSLSPPTSPLLVVGVWPGPGEVAYCIPDFTPGNVFRTDEVLRKGVVAQDTCDKTGKVPAKFKPKPGTIVFFVRKLSFWEKLACRIAGTC